MVKEIGKAIGKKRPIISIPPSLGYLIGSIIGKVIGDVMITHDEIKGLMAGLLCTNSQPVGHTKLTDWARENSSTLGIKYSSELARRKNRMESYDRL